MWIFLWLMLLGALAYHKVTAISALITVSSALVVSYSIQLISLTSLIMAMILILPASILVISPSLRRKYLTNFILKKIGRSIPKISPTERAALNAGTVWWDAELFSGAPDWSKLFNIVPSLSKAENDFLNGPVEELCRVIDNWKINYRDYDMSPDMWSFLKKNKFFGLIIPTEYGGLGFSALAHSEILAKIAGKSITVASTVSVPNSLGPGELILNYGTDTQKEYYLPKLASGEEIPCFALTSQVAGSDATAITDTGMVVRKDGKVGILLNWNKRYITLAPIATVMGLAFKLYDPNKIISDNIDIGITCALISTNHTGVKVGERHWPLSCMFINGPTKGNDVFIGLDAIIGGIEMAGHGWKMLVESLSVGRAISLPAVTTGKARIAAQSTGAYASIRKQFNLPIGKFEGVSQLLARMACNLYICDSARTITAAAIDAGEHPTVPGAIVKYHVTERSRQISIDAMDIHAGKGIMQGPRNYIADGYINAPIGITVEGSNVLTRNMLIFGQGAIRCHPFIMRELTAMQGAKQLNNFDVILYKHFGYTLSNMAKSIWSYLTRGRFLRLPNRTCQKITWASSAFAFISDVCLVTLGGKLKFKENISARLGDMLSFLYLASMTLKRFCDDGQPEADKVLMQYCVQQLLAEFWQSLDLVLRNFPNRYVATLLRLAAMPFGIPVHPPTDTESHKVADILLKDNPTRARLLSSAYLCDNPLNPPGQIESALKKVKAAEEIEQRLTRAIKDGVIDALDFKEQIRQGLALTLISEAEATLLQQAAVAREEVLAVDSFDAISKKTTDIINNSIFM